MNAKYYRLWKKIRFTSKKAPRGNKLQRAAGEREYSSILYRGETVGCVEGSNFVTLFTRPKNTRLTIKRESVKTHRDAVNFVKENAEYLYNTYLKQS